VTHYNLVQLQRFVASHGLLAEPVIVDGRVRFTSHDGTHHAITTLRAAREALGY